MSESLKFVTHDDLKPFVFPDSEILILGSLPSEKSREECFYYAHKSNRFYKLIAAVFGENPPQNLDEKKTLLRKHKIALYDCIESCYIRKSSDSSIKNPKPADIKSIIKGTKITRIYTTGKKAYKIYQKYIEKTIDIVATPLPSSSAANASMSFGKLIKEYSVITK